jgi:hypothetical protein
MATAQPRNVLPASPIKTFIFDLNVKVNTINVRIEVHKKASRVV